jgi:hypothetical protein
VTRVLAGGGARERGREAEGERGRGAEEKRRWGGGGGMHRTMAGSGAP